MDHQKQFELMATLRAYAKQIAEMPDGDTRPSIAALYRQKIARMMDLQKQLDCQS